MGPRSAAGCHGDWHSGSDFSSEAVLDPYGTRHEEPSKQTTIPCDAVQQKPKKANSRKVHPEPTPPPKSWNENGDAHEVQSKHRSRHPENGAAQRTCEGSTVRDRNSNTDVADNHVDHGQRIAHDGSCKIDILEQRQPLLELEDHGYVKEILDRSFLWRIFSELLRRPSELLRRLSKLLRRLLDPSPNYFCGIWEPLNIFVKRNGGREKATGKGDLESLPGDVQERIFGRLRLKELTQRAFFRRSRGLSREGAFTALNFFIEHEEWQCTGFDLLTKEWKRLTTLACLPSPDLNLFQQYSICGHGDLMCANVSKSSHKEELVVFNISTGEKKELPPLKFPRNPVLLHIWVDSVTDSYKVIAAGSASSSGEDLSRRIEVYDSRTLEWETMSDIRGPEFGLNEHQVGVCVNGVLYFIMFLNGDDGQKGIVAFDIEKGEWLEDKTCSLPFSSFCNTLQLLENCGKLYLFSEQERDGVVEHCIDVVELWEDSDTGEECWQLRTVVRVTKSSGRGLLVYPEYTCVPFGIGKLCVFNTITREGVVYDLDNGMQPGVLEAPPENQRGENFFCLNPVSFTLATNLANKP